MKQDECKHQFRFIKILQKKPLIILFYCVHCLATVPKRCDWTEKDMIRISEEHYQRLYSKHTEKYREKHKEIKKVHGKKI